MSDEVPKVHRELAEGRTREFAADLVLLLGGAFLPGLVVGMCIVAVLAIAHLAK